MYFNGIENNYNMDFYDLNVSLHSGIPKHYYYLKDKQFGDWEIPPWELFIFKDRLIGQGAFSNVYLAKWRETFVVAKVISSDFFKLKKEIVLREIDIMTKLHHPNIVQFLGFIDDPFILVLEYIPNFDLLTNIPKLSKTQKISIMKDILRGIAYIHNRKPYSLIHRDIKTSNILLTNSRVAKIADFGLSKFYNIHKIDSFNSLKDLKDDNNDTNKVNDFHNESIKKKLLLQNNELTDIVGTERYMAPEMSKDSHDYNNKIDIYACGIIFYEMFENKRYIPHVEFKWYYTPKKIKNIIINNMLCKNPDDRYDAIAILKIFNKLNI